MWSKSRFKEDVVVMFNIGNSFVQVCNTNLVEGKFCQMLGFER